VKWNHQGSTVGERDDTGKKDFTGRKDDFILVSMKSRLGRQR
jgi:hypothetical protein